MISVRDFNDWRRKARRCLRDGITPEEVRFASEDDDQPLLDLPEEAPEQPHEQSGEALHEPQRGVGNLPPAGVNRQRVPAARHLDDLGHALIALLLLVGRVGDRPGDRMVRVGLDDQHWTPLRVHRVHLRL